MMNEFGAVTPLCSFVYITVNGEDWGLYLAVEGVEDSFLKRNYGSNYGELYKPDSMSFGGGRGNGRDFNMDDFLNREISDDHPAQDGTVPQMPDMSNSDPSSMFGGSMPDMSNFDPSQMPENFGGAMPDMGNFDPSQMQGEIPQMPDAAQTESGSENREKFSFGGMGGFGMGSSDVKLQYVDDNPSSYSNIWNNAKTDITAADQTRLIESLKKLSNGEQLESVVDIEQVIRYFVVHNYVCNGDSYTGSMIHNYYLYEENGQMAMIPWDYNLAFGTFHGGSGQSTVNTPIDAPVSGGTGEDRPMWNWIMSDAAYTELYHQYFAEFLNTVDVQGIIDNAYSLIKPYVEKDPTAFYTYEEFEAGIETLREFCALRSQSISMQLENGQTTTDMSYVDASGLTVSDMGSMGGKGGFGGTPGRNSDNSELGTRKPFGTSSDETDATASATSTANEPMPGGFGGQMPNMGAIPEGFEPSQMPDGMNFSPLSSAAPVQPTEEAETVPSGEPEATEPPEKNNPSSRTNMRLPGGDFNSNRTAMGNAAQSSANWIWLAASVLILGVGLLIAKMYKRY